MLFRPVQDVAWRPDNVALLDDHPQDDSVTMLEMQFEFVVGVGV